MNGVMENILSIPSERVQKSENSISNLDVNSHQFVAVVKDKDGIEKVIGCAGLSVYASPRLRHSAGIGIMVHKDFQRMGAGQKLMEAMLDMADNWLMLVRVELPFIRIMKERLNCIKKWDLNLKGSNERQQFATDSMQMNTSWHESGIVSSFSELRRSTAHAFAKYIDKIAQTVKSAVQCNIQDFSVCGFQHLSRFGKTETVNVLNRRFHCIFFKYAAKMPGAYAAALGEHVDCEIRLVVILHIFDYILDDFRRCVLRPVLMDKGTTGLS